MIRYQIFLHIVESGSYTKTAEAFGYTQSAVSQIVKSLEAEFNIILFSRSRYGITLTSDGASIVPLIRKMCEDYAKVLNRSSEVTNLEGAVIRVGAFASVSANFLPAVIKKFKEKYPSVQFKLLQGSYENIAEWIKDGSVDFGFLTVATAKQFKSIPILQDEMVMILPKGHPKAKKERVNMRDFENEPFIFLDQGKKSEPMEYFNDAGIELNRQYHVYDDYTIMNMVEQGLGVAILPKLVLYRHHQQIEVRSLTPPIFRRMCVAYRADEAISVAGRRFMDFVVASAEKDLQAYH